MNSIMEQIKNLALRIEKRQFERPEYLKVGDAASIRCQFPFHSSFSVQLRRRLPSPAVMKLNLCAELASCISLKTSGWIKHTLVISQGLEPCHAHINYYRSSICDCPSVALATYWMHSRFPESYTSTHTNTKMHTHLSRCPPLPSKALHQQSSVSLWRSVLRIKRVCVFLATCPYSFIIMENNRLIRHFLYV